jgi:hypothetical protein
MSYEYLVASPTTLLSLAKDIKQQGNTYELQEIEFKEHNSYWNGKRGLTLKVTTETYLNLFNSKRHEV